MDDRAVASAPFGLVQRFIGPLADALHVLMHGIEADLGDADAQRDLQWLCRHFPSACFAASPTPARLLFGFVVDLPFISYLLKPDKRGRSGGNRRLMKISIE